MLLWWTSVIPSHVTAFDNHGWNIDKMSMQILPSYGRTHPSLLRKGRRLLCCEKTADVPAMAQMEVLDRKFNYIKIQKRKARNNWPKKEKKEKKKKKKELYCNFFCDLFVITDNSLCLCLSVCLCLCLSVCLSVCLFSLSYYLPFFFLSFLLLLCLKLLYVHTHENVFVNQVLNLKISTLFDCDFCTLFVLFSDMFWTVLHCVFIVHNHKLWRKFSLSSCFWCNYL